MAKLRCGLIGWPVEHSLSPKLHAYAAKSRGIDLSYELFPVEPGKVTSAVMDLYEKGFNGLNVTTPHKEKCTDALDWLEDNAFAIGAVNTIQFGGQFRRGFNTDFTGAMKLFQDLDRVHLDGVRLAESHLLVIGGGPAARAIALAWRLVGANRDLLVRETRPGLKEFALASGAGLWRISDSEDVEACFYDKNIIVYAGPPAVSLVDIGLSDELFRDQAETKLVMDLNYGQGVSDMLDAAKAAGKRTMNGLGLLCYQAADSFNIWTGSDVTGKELLDYLIAEGHDAALSDGR